METPKILWLKENLRESFDNAWQFFDLADFLTWKSTDSLSRSTCTLTCKWTYLAHEKRWDEDYFRQIGLAELADENFARIGQHIVEPGTPCGQGLAEDAAQQMGLLAGTPVAAGMIDAHARAVIAGLGMENNFDNLLSLYIAGICGIGYGLRQIIEAQAKSGAEIENIVISGGAGQHPFVRQLLADTCGITVITTQASEPVLLGSAILGAVAGGIFENVGQAMTHFPVIDRIYQPNEAYCENHNIRFASFQRLQQCARQLKG